jgi:hypothetical protein
MLDLISTPEDPVYRESSSLLSLLLLAVSVPWKRTEWEWGIGSMNKPNLT